MTQPTISADVLRATQASGLDRPSWVIATLFPNQGDWTEWDFLSLPTTRLAELSDGNLEILEMPTLRHQDIVFLLTMLLKQYLAEHLPGGRAVAAPYPLRLWQDKIREPDIAVVKPENAGLWTDRYAGGADLVVEVVSPGDPGRDKVLKRAEYAKAGIPEYWIVDPVQETITILALEDSEYVEVGVFPRGERATSRLLVGFGVDVSEALAGA